jgi:hypothetical protein
MKKTVLNIVVDNPVIITEVNRELEKFLSLSPERIKIVHKGKDKKRRNKKRKGGI